MNNGRALSPWHEVNLYISQDSLQQGIDSYRVANAKKGIKDYIFVLMHSPDGHHERELEATRQGLINVQMQFRDEIDHDDIEQKLSKMQAHPYMLYFVPQLLTPDQCLAGIKQGEEDLSEINEVLEGMEDEEALCTLHEYLFAAPPVTHNDYYEIGYPAKFKSRLMQDEGWKIIDIIKEGAFARNKLLKDDVIIAEISGFTGSSGQSYKREISLANRAQVETARNEISDSLTGNAFWTASMLAHIDEAVKEFPDKDANITVFNPATALFTLYFAAPKDEGVTFVPSYFIEIPITKNKTRAYFGRFSFPRTNERLKKCLMNTMMEKLEIYL